MRTECCRSCVRAPPGFRYGDRGIWFLLVTQYALVAVGGACITAVRQPQDIPLVHVHSCSSSGMKDAIGINNNDINMRLGEAIGRATKAMIQQRITESKGIQKLIVYYNTTAGESMLRDMVEKHSQGPGKALVRYIRELQGLAAGACMPWTHLLLTNMRQEMLAALDAQQQPPEDSCTDVLLSLPGGQAGATSGSSGRPVTRSAGYPDQMTLVGHNEDMTRDTLGRVYFVHFEANQTTVQSDKYSLRSTPSGCGAQCDEDLQHDVQQYESVPNAAHRQAGASTTTTSSHANGTHLRLREHLSPSHTRQLQAQARQPHANSRAYLAQAPEPQPLSWLAFVYAGELASSGFGINAAGIGFTLNAVFPMQSAVPGIARNFVSRQLLEARSIAEALKIVGQPGQAIGHSYNIFDIHSKRLWNVEVGPGSAMSVMEVTRGSYYFHANMFKHLVVRQRTDNSSYHREARSLQLQAPNNAEELLAILGDTADADYPIYRHGTSAADSSVVTLCTALFNLEAGTMDVWTGNPGQPDSRKLQMRFNLSSLHLMPAEEHLMPAEEHQPHSRSTLRVA